MHNNNNNNNNNNNKFAGMKKEYIWLLIIFVISIIITGLNFGFDNYLDDEGYIQIYTTYFVVIPIIFGMVIFVLISFLFFGLLIFISGSKNNLRLWILAINNLILIFLLSIMIKFEVDLQGEVSIYPPLSGLPEAKDNKSNQESNTIYILWIIQMFLALTLFFEGFLIGKKINTIHR